MYLHLFLYFQLDGFLSGSREKTAIIYIVGDKFTCACIIVNFRYFNNLTRKVKYHQV